jgi:hypothetical protein
MKLWPIVLLVLLSACAFSEVPIRLPTADVQTGLSGGDGRQIVLAAPFEDQRQEKTRCGTQKNTYNMETADASCDIQPSEWIAKLLASELRAAGFTVLTPDEASKPSAVKLQGTVLTLFVEPVIGFTTVSLETDVNVKLIASSETGLLAERTFFVKGLASGLAATAGNFQTSVDDATQKIAKDIVAAVISLMNRYPQLGLYNSGPRTLHLALQG